MKKMASDFGRPIEPEPVGLNKHIFFIYTIDIYLLRQDQENCRLTKILKEVYEKLN